MSRLPVALLALLSTAALLWFAAPRRGDAVVYDVVTVKTSAELQAALDALDQASSQVQIALDPGDYHLTPSPAVDSTCGNCEDPDQPVPVTVGARLTGREIQLIGRRRGTVTIHTNGGYGLFVEDCVNCFIGTVTITGGERDTSQNATDAAIVVKNASVHISDVTIRDNIGDEALLQKNVVGIMGVCGREGADIDLYGSRIIRNSWDGVALYRGANAIIRDCVIDGVDKARGREAGGGRGVGIGVTWDATATIMHNLVRRYWKGIGIFVDGSADVRYNVIEEMLTWGIAYWDAGRGKPQATILYNIVYDCGACGVSITREAPAKPGEPLPGRLSGNVIVRTGQNEKYDDPEYYCMQCALALHAVPDGFKIGTNFFSDNRTAADSLFNEDTGRDTLLAAAAPLVGALRGDSLFSESRFVSEYLGGGSE